MYTTSYSPRPDLVWYPSDETYNDSLWQDYIKRLDILDGFIYLLDLYKVVEDCAKDIRDYINNEKFDFSSFRKANKVVLAYFNAVYTLKQYIQVYRNSPHIRKIEERFYLNNNWYRFACDYRNLITHHASLVKDYNLKTSEPFIHLEELSTRTLQEIDNIRIKDPLKRDAKIENKQRFILKINELYSTDEIVILNGNHYLSVFTLVKNSLNEIHEMMEEIIAKDYSHAVTWSIKWIIKKIHKHNSFCTCTRLENESNTIELNLVIEDYLDMLLISLGKGNPIFIQFVQLLIESGYQYLFKTKQTLLTYCKDLDILDDGT